jgi:tetratricopeptide (TPR) repeat protein
MTEWVPILSSVGAGLIASLVSSWIIGRLKREKDVVYDVALSSGRRQEVRVSKSHASDVDSSTQEALFGALNLMSRDDIDPKSQDRLRRLVAELERQRTIAPLSRSLVLVLGRAYRNLGEPQKATGILSEYIASKERNQQRDRDLGDAYYNLACYLALDGQRPLAVENLRKAISLNPDNIGAAKSDPDLSSIREQLKEVLPADPVA